MLDKFIFLRQHPLICFPYFFFLLLIAVHSKGKYWLPILHQTQRSSFLRNTLGNNSLLSLFSFNFIPYPQLFPSRGTLGPSSKGLTKEVGISNLKMFYPLNMDRKPTYA